MNPLYFQGIILAAGASSRMGRIKWSLEIAGKTFLRHIEDCYHRAGVKDVFAVFREGQAAEGSFIPLINPEPERGQLSSLKVALEAILPQSPFIMQLVDRPLVESGTFTSMMKSYDGSIVIPTFKGRKGHPVIFPPPLREILLETDDALGIRSGIEAWKGEIKLLPVDDESILWNIDTPEALEKYSRAYDLNLG